MKIENQLLQVPDDTLNANLVKDMEETQTFEQLIAKGKTLIQTPKTVGGYDITGGSEQYIVFNMTKKPNVVHRFFCRLLLGWKWIDEEK